MLRRNGVRFAELRCGSIWAIAASPVAPGCVRLPPLHTGFVGAIAQLSRSVPCMDEARGEESDVSANGRVRSCIRPFIATVVAADHDV